MKIEKINDNQIRCTLTRADLDDRKIHLSELAYGTEKARDLFRDMMQQAHYEFGFEADNIPLMIEAIPVSPDSIILIITKVEEPEELDTRFSRFAPSSDSPAPSKEVSFGGADDILDIFQRIAEVKSKAKAARADNKPEKESTISIPVNIIREYVFPHLDLVIDAAHSLNGYYNGKNSLYKVPRTDEYSLIVHQSDCTAEQFNKVCNILSEYGYGQNSSPAAEAHLQEHAESIIANDALQKLMTL